MAARQKIAGTSRTAAATMLRNGRRARLRLRVEFRDEVLLAPVRPDAVRADDVVLARTGLMPGGPGTLVLEKVTGVRADVARLESGGWVLLENIFGKVISDE